jgi:predicted DCC family thiol-disulfide oxidoreductase YuxK
VTAPSDELSSQATTGREAAATGVDAQAARSVVDAEAAPGIDAQVTAPSEAGPVLLFDGVCNLCNAAVSFVIDRDPQGKVRFAALQSDVGVALLARYAAQLPHGSLPERANDDPPTVFLIEGGRIYDRSTAVLRLLKHLNGLWPVLSVYVVLPVGLRDAVYDFVAKRRYRWFGRKDSCRLPTPDEARRFLG